MKKSTKFIRICKKYGVDPDNFPTEVMSFEDACKITGDNPMNMPVVSGISERHKNRIIADYQLSIIAQGIRNNVDVDYNDTDKRKHFAWFEVKADKKRCSGFGLSFVGDGGWHSFSFIGVRLCFPNSDQAIFFGKHFLKLHVDHHLYT